jgi:hypothetical protein
MARIIDFFDGAESELTPVIGNIEAADLVDFPDDASYEAANVGAPFAGNIYFNTTDNTVRYYDGANWIEVGRAVDIQENADDIADLRSTTGTSDGDTDMGTYTPGSNFSLTDNQSTKQNLQEVANQIDTNVGNINTNTNDIADNAADIATNTFDINTNTNDISDLQNDKQDISEKGQPNGYAELDGSGQVPPSQLPSYVDDVLEFADLASFPATGETGKIYVALDTNLTYRWSGSVYIETSPNDVNSVNGLTGVVNLDTDDIPEGTTNEYYTNAKADARIANASIDNLSDVDTSTVAPSNDEVLKWDGSNWVPGAASSGSTVNLIGGGDLENSTPTSAPTSNVYNETNNTGGFAGGPVVNGIAQSFTSAISGKVTSIDAYIYDGNGGLTGDIFIEIYNASGGVPTTDQGVGVLATSNTVDATTIPDTPGAATTFTFNAVGADYMVAGQQYAFVVRSTNLSTNLWFLRDNTNPNTGEIRLWDGSTTWDPFLSGSDLLGVVEVTGSINGQLSFTENLFLEKPGLEYVDNQIPIGESPIIFPNDRDVAYVVPNNAPGGGNLSVTVDSLDNVPNNAAIIARRDGDDITVGTSMKLEIGDIAKLYKNSSNLGSIDEHSDVDVTSSTPSEGQSLVYDGANFVNKKPVLPDSTISALDIDWSLADVFTKDISSNQTFTFSNAEDGDIITVIINNTTGFQYDMTFPSAHWVNAIPITNVDASSQTVFTFIKAGGIIYANAIESFLPPGGP